MLGARGTASLDSPSYKLPHNGLCSASHLSLEIALLPAARPEAQLAPALPLLHLGGLLMRQPQLLKQMHPAARLDAVRRQRVHRQCSQGVWQINTGTTSAHANRQC